MKKKDINKISRDAFIDAYFKCLGSGAKAMEALGLKGGSARTMASNYLKEPYVQEEIARRRQKIEESSDITIEAKRKLLWDIATKERNVYAIAELNKMDGHHKPTNVDVKSDGKRIEGCAVLILPNEDIGALHAQSDT